MANEEERDVDMGEGTGADDDSEDFELNEADQQRIMDLESQLETNKAVYDSHVQLIELLRKCKLKARLRSARERMHSLYPFNESQWMEWINDEMDSISSQEDIARIRQLFQLAVEDYISVTLWESYLEFLQAVDPEVSSKSPAGVDAFRHAAEAALTAAGLHLAEGPELWSLYRSFEQDLAEQSSDEKQVERVRTLFHRQLQLPQLSAADLLQEYDTWEAEYGKGSVPDHIRAAAERSASAAQLRAAHEAAVGPGKTPDASLLAAYMAYIQLEKAQRNPARVQLLYERAVAAFPVTSELWVQYTRYLETELKVPAVINKVYARAVRNCPWVGPLWAAAMRALERLNGSDDEHAALADRALAAGMQNVEDYMLVLLARADCLRRQLSTPPDIASEAVTKLRAWFRRSHDTITQYFPDLVESSLRLPSYWAHVEGVVLDDKAAMRAVWEETVKGPLGRYYETWLAWTTMERQLRQIPQARSLFKRCYSRKLEEGGQLALAYEWLRFEREEGSAEDLFQATLKVDPIIEEANVAATAATNQPAAAAARAAANNAKKLSREEVKAMRRAHDPNFKERKPGTKRDQNGQEKDTSHAKRSKAKEAQPPPGDTDMAEARTAAPQDQPSTSQPVEPVLYTDQHTVFVKGLGFDVHEEDLRRLFSKLGVKSIRMGKDKFTGALRGFAYVDFDTDEAVQKASEQDGTVVNGRRLFIAKSAPPSGSGRGRGRGGRGFGARGRAFDGSREVGGRSGGQEGGRNRGGGDRGRGGLGYYGSRDDVPSAAHSNPGHMRHHLQMDEDRTGARMPVLVPRALIPKQSAAQQQQQANGTADTQPKTNEDFKKMLQR